MTTPASLDRSSVLAHAVPLAEGRSLEVTPQPDGATLRLRSPRPGEVMELELRFEASGPVVRVKAPEVEVAVDGRFVARCDEFAVEARESIRLQSEGTIVQESKDAATVRARSMTIDASPGAVRLRANDDVQLLGELILLNCDRTPPLPQWVPPGRGQPASLPPSVATGDDVVIAEMQRDPKER